MYIDIKFSKFQVEFLVQKKKVASWHILHFYINESKIKPENSNHFLIGTIEVEIPWDGSTGWETYYW